MERPHALAVGCSGMLAGACHGLASRGWEVTMIARGQGKLATAAAGSPHLWPVAVDYRDHAAFAAALAAATAQRGPITLALCWIRSSASETLAAAAAAVADGGRVVHVLGSAHRDPSIYASAELRRQRRIGYQAVVLGYVADNGYDRWLTDAEISDGTLAAVDDHTLDPHVVGTIDRWAARP